MLPVQITLRDHMPASPAIESQIRKKAEKLIRYCKTLISCRVVIDTPQRHKHQGKLYAVRLDLKVPGKELVVTRKQHEDLYVAIRDAFSAAGRQLEEHSRKRHGHVKTHSLVSHGHIRRLIPAEGFGFIEGTDGQECYFSMTNVSYPQFAQLAIGDAVEYIAEPLSDGWQAHHVVKEKHQREEIVF